MKGVRSWIAVSAHFRQAGSMGPSKKQKVRKERKQAKQELRKETHERRDV